MKKISSLLVILFLAPLLWSCATVNSTSQKIMPSEKQIDIMPWKDYEAAEEAFQKIEWEKTLITETKDFGFDHKAKGVTIIDDPLAIRDIILGNNSSFKMENLPKNLQDYLKDLNDCKAFKFEGRYSATNPKGNILQRWFNFKKIDVDSVWAYEGWVFIKKSTGIITYTKWIGYKPPDKSKVKKNPLGPLQEFGNIITGVTKGLID